MTLSKDELAAYEAGKDCAIHGATDKNCHWCFFETPKQTAAWQRGKAEHKRKSCGCGPAR